MKKDIIKKSNKIRAEKNEARKPRLTKDEREAKKLKLQEERAAKKAERLAKREAKKQKEAERKAAAKAKREERKAKRLARLQAEKERKEAQKLKAKELAEAKKVREAARLEKKAAREAKKAERQVQPEKNVKNDPEVKKVSVQEKIEAERNEWKALSAIRRYVKNNAKILEELDGDKLARKIKKFQKMGYTIDVENGTPISIGYDFEIGVRIKTAKPSSEKKEQQPRKTCADEKTAEVQQPQDSGKTVVLEQPNEESEEEKLLSDDEILEAAKQDKEAGGVEVLAGDTFKDESEIVEDDSLKNSEDGDGDLDDVDNDDDDDDDDDDEDDDNDDDILGGVGISREQEEYRHDAFREMESDGAWD